MQTIHYGHMREDIIMDLLSHKVDEMGLIRNQHKKVSMGKKAMQPSQSQSKPNQARSRSQQMAARVS